MGCDHEYPNMRPISDPAKSKLMKPKLELVIMLLINTDGRSLAPIVKKRKAKKDFIGVMPAENTSMLKSAY